MAAALPSLCMIRSVMALTVSWRIPSVGGLGLHTGSFSRLHQIDMPARRQSELTLKVQIELCKINMRRKKQTQMEVRTLS